MMDEGVLESQANTPHPDHGEYGSQSVGYSGQVPAQSPYSDFAVYDGYDESLSAVYGGTGYRVQGQETDETPETHVAPYPRGIIQYNHQAPDNLALAGQQMLQLHQPDMGGPSLYVMGASAGHEEATDYTTDRYPAPNDNVLSTELGNQLKGSRSAGQSGTYGGNADTTQGYGVLNTLDEFQRGHSIRRVQHDKMPMDYTATHGEQEVPFWGRHPVQQMPLDGPDSPYYQQGNIDGANVVWEGRIGYPTTYQQPAEPTIIPPQTDETDVWAYA